MCAAMSGTQEARESSLVINLHRPGDNDCSGPECLGPLCGLVLNARTFMQLAHSASSTAPAAVRIPTRSHMAAR